MESAKQTVEGGKLLDGLISLFFKGFDGVLNAAAEYKDDYGVLKQVSKIPLIDKGNGNKPYTLTIELSPVKDKEGLFYVTATTDAPGFDLSSINEKVFKINKNTMEGFNKLVEDLIEKHNLSIKPKDEEAEGEESDEEEVEETTREQDNEIASSLSEIEEELDSSEVFLLNDENEAFAMRFILEHEKGDTVGVLKLYLLDSEGNTSNKYATEEFEFNIFQEGSSSKYSFDDEATFAKFIVDAVKQYVAKYKLEPGDQTNIPDEINDVLSSTCISSVKATFVKSSVTNRIHLTAIRASRNIEGSMKLVCSMMEEEDFIELLSDEPKSFEIKEYEDGYDVNPIDSFSTSCCIRRNPIR